MQYLWFSYIATITYAAEVEWIILCSKLFQFSIAIVDSCYAVKKAYKPVRLEYFDHGGLTVEY